MGELRREVGDYKLRMRAGLKIPSVLNSGAIVLM